EGLCQRTTMKFTVIRAPSPYNVILGRTCLRALRAIPSTIHSMMKFPTLRGIATLVTKSVIISECQRLEKKQVVAEEKEAGTKTVNVTEEKRRVLAPEKSRVVTRDVKEWVKAGIVWPVRYKCFLDAYKGYHQIHMSKEDEEKTTFYTDQRTYCYTKMSFKLKNARATYQRLIDSNFQSQIERNLEAYMDDMVIRINDEKMLLADVAETFNNLRKINMKLNPKKCSFGVEEGKFLGYMEMQSLAEKLAALNRFLAKSTERSLPLFNTLKNITKENKHEYKWTIKAEEAFQQMK
ncbi:reverse transcriptase domain-containing protein, partial [Tanacetum coccineum]